MLHYLPNSYYKHILGQEPRELDQRSKTIIEQRLQPFGLAELTDKTDVVAIPIPEGFGTVQEELAKAYVEYDNRWLSFMELVDAELPETPKAFNCPAGWSVWGGSRWFLCEAPSAMTMIVDMETTNIGDGVWHPTCAVCTDGHDWYVWRADFADIYTTSVVPFEGHNTFVGYNVPYDRSFMSCEYLVEDQHNRFIDLMSMWIVTNGMSNQQRTTFSSFKDDDADEGYDMSRPMWAKLTGTNGLASAYEFYTKKTLDKGVRDNIVDGGVDWSSSNMTSVIKYCLLDVVATHELAKHLVPAYTAHRPSKVNRYGAIALGSCWVPLSADRFPSFYENVEKVYQQKKVKLNTMLMEATTAYMTEGVPTSGDHLDWTEAKTGNNKGLPKWYRDVLAAYRKGSLSLSQRFAPTVLKMTWLGQPLLWDADTKGWYTTEHGAIPHPTKRGQAVASMFLKDFAHLYDTDAIGSSNDDTKAVVKEKASTINWVSSRKRVKGIHTESPEGFPVTIPMMSVNGTITGRATDAIWMVLANPKANRIGTELKTMVEAFPGYKLVGADIDSQEAWLAGIHGDQEMGFCASTPFGAINAMGNSKDKTDIHSIVSTNTGYSRDVCKTRVYGAIYGQGVKGDSDVILKNDPNLQPSKATSDSKAFLSLFKGNKNYDDGTYKNGIASHSFTRMELIADRRMPATPLTGARMTNALAGIADYKPTRVNWVVQASGVDFRDMLVLLTNSFYKKLNVSGRLVLTIHDEIRTMVKDEDVIKATYAIQLAHLYVRTAFILAHKLDNIPAGAAWFSAVDIDTVLRKDPEATQVTPTQPNGIAPGYTVNAKQLLGKL